MLRVKGQAVSQVSQWKAEQSYEWEVTPDQAITILLASC